jgi:uncharacterized membrane protein
MRVIRNTLLSGLAVVLPIIVTVYSSMRDLMSYFRDNDQKKATDQVAMVSLGDGRTRLLGMVTRSDLAKLPDGIGSEDEVAVYLPMSYQVGGFTVVVPRSRIEPVDVSFEEGMRLAVTAFVTHRKRSPIREAAAQPDEQP